MLGGIFSGVAPGTLAQASRTLSMVAWVVPSVNVTTASCWLMAASNLAQPESSNAAAPSAAVAAVRTPTTRRSARMGLTLSGPAHRYGSQQTNAPPQNY